MPAMKLAELLLALDELSRSEKFRALQFLIAELAQEEDAVLVPEYPVWSPYDAVGAAQTLTQYLREQPEPNRSGSALVQFQKPWCSA